MRRGLEQMGSLQCRLPERKIQKTPPRLLVVLNHGFGAPGDDLVDLAYWLMDSQDAIAAGCVFAFPWAPIDLSSHGMPGGRAWWPLNMAQLAELNQTRRFDQLTSMEPEGLVPASNQLSETIRLLQQRFGVNNAATVLGGFSQGAMVSTDVVLRRQLCPALLTLFSGTLLTREDWSTMAASHPGCRVLQAHGSIDPILPIEPARQLHRLLSDNGFSTEFIEFHGPHTITVDCLQRLSDILTELVG